MSRFDAIEANLSLFERQSAEKWQAEHEEAMQCRVLEDVIAHGLMIHDRLSEACEQAGSSMSSSCAFDQPTVERFCNAWGQWLRSCEGVLDRIEIFESRGFALEGSSEFRESVAKIKSMPWSIEEVLRLRERFKNPGKTVPLKDAVDELLRRADARRH